MHKATALHNITNARKLAAITGLADSLRIARNVRDGFDYSAETLARAATAPAGILAAD